MNVGLHLQNYHNLGMGRFFHNFGGFKIINSHKLEQKFLISSYLLLGFYD